MAEDEEEQDASWPREVRPLSISELGKLGIGPNNKLHWDGAPLRVSGPVKFGAALALLGAFAGGLGSVASAIIAFNSYYTSISSSPSKESSSSRIEALKTRSNRLRWIWQRRPPRQEILLLTNSRRQTRYMPSRWRYKDLEQKLRCAHRQPKLL